MHAFTEVRTFGFGVALVGCFLCNASASYGAAMAGTVNYLGRNSAARTVTLELGEGIGYLKIFADLLDSGIKLGSTSPTFDNNDEGGTNDLLVYADRAGLPAGVYTLGPIGNATHFHIYYGALGSAAPVTLVGVGPEHHTDPTNASAAFKYRPSTGDLTLSIRSANVGVVGLQYAQQSEFDLSALEHPAALGTPGQQQNDVVAFYNLAGLPIGEFDLGPVIPRGLDAFDLAIRYDTGYSPLGGDSINPAIVIVPEPTSGVLFAVAALCSSAHGLRKLI
jgi:hypothetical protein